MENSTNNFDHSFELPYGKATFACTYKQVDYARKLAEQTDSIITPNNSQLMKRFEMAEMSEAIDMMKNGHKISIS